MVSRKVTVSLYSQVTSNHLPLKYMVKSDDSISYPKVEFIVSLGDGEVKMVSCTFLL